MTKGLFFASVGTPTYNLGSRKFALQNSEGSSKKPSASGLKLSVTKFSEPDFWKRHSPTCKAPLASIPDTYSTDEHFSPKEVLFLRERLEKK